MKSIEKKNYLVDTDWFDYQFIEQFLYKDLKIKPYTFLLELLFHQDF